MKEFFSDIVKLALFFFLLGDVNEVLAYKIQDFPLNQRLAEPVDVYVGKVIINENGIQVKVKDVLKGANNILGKTVRFKHTKYQLFSRKRLTNSNNTLLIVPRDSNKNTKLAKDKRVIFIQRPVLRVYQNDEAVEAANIILGIQSEKLNETRTLEKLFENSLTYSNFYLGEYFVSELKHMRRRENFSMLIRAFDKAEQKMKIELIQLLKYIRDERAVPVLISSLESKSVRVRNEAANVLYWRFFSLPEVSKAISQLKKTEGLEWLIEKNQYGAGYKKPTKWQRTLNAFNDKGDLNILSEFALDEANYLSWRLQAYQLYSNHIVSKDNSDFCKRWSLSLSKKMNEGNYLSNTEIIEKLREVYLCEHIELYTHAILGEPKFSMEKALIQSIFAIKDLNDKRNFGITKLLVDDLRKQSSQFKIHYRLSTLFWLEECGSLVAIRTQLNKSVLRYWDEYFNLFCPKTKQINNTKLENLLISNLPKSNTFLLRMIITRIEELMPVSGEAFILSNLAQAISYKYITIKALAKIKGGKTVNRILELMESKNIETRRFATDAITAILKKESLPYLRKSIKSSEYGHSLDAFSGIGKYGEKSDIALLHPYCYFWKRKLEDTYFPCLAFDELKRRYKMD
ncbi:HEAT repeat domain-containing protein [Aliikangiella sp. IMCC44359]|uniref:HEAT repeat domain-containing protein n=1 Tax=Aliikangiella sp. IMCC44359 TaxID=3459125 RepID=UPI00403B386A